MAATTASTRSEEAFPHSASGLPSPCRQLAAPGLPPEDGGGVGVGAVVTGGVEPAGELPPPQERLSEAPMQAARAATTAPAKRRLLTDIHDPSFSYHQAGEQVVTYRRITAR
jgi:hypothetical protein